LPATVCDSPQASENEQHPELILPRHPDDHRDNQRIVNQGSEDQTVHTTDVLRYVSESETAQRVAHAEHDHDQADVFHADGTRDKALERSQQMTELDPSSGDVTYFGELRTDIGLLQTRPEREWNEQELVWILEMLECRSQMMNRIFQCVFDRAWMFDR
jgi:hypothetical protein